LVEKQLGKGIKILRINNGGEYKSFEFNQFFQKWRNSMTIYSSMYTLQQNGVAKCKNRTLMEVVFSMLHNFGFSNDIGLKFCWQQTIFKIKLLQKHLVYKKSYRIVDWYKDKIDLFKNVQMQNICIYVEGPKKKIKSSYY
jgi:hypothetical protein